MGDSEGITVEYVKAKVAEIAAIAGDYEAAHGLEDDLYADVLRHFAAHAQTPLNEIAAEALKTSEIKFARHCA